MASGRDGEKWGKYSDIPENRRGDFSRMYWEKILTAREKCALKNDKAKRGGKRGRRKKEEECESEDIYLEILI